jgi:thiol-disulfide isomerase/thioredoxin
VLEGLIVLVAVLAAASAAGFALRSRQGRFRAARPQAAQLPGDLAAGDLAHGAGARSTPIPATNAADTGRPTTAGDALTAADLGAPLGAQVTLVQFSTEVCAYCGPTRQLLAEMARERDGIAFIEIDAAERMDLTRRLRVLSTPTVLVLDAAGGIASRASGPPRRADLVTAVSQVAGPAGGTS